jgi:hypothetical protein
MSGISKTIYYDQETNALIDGNSVSSVQSGIIPQIYRGDEHVILKMYIYSDASTSTVSNCAGLTYSLKVGEPGKTAVITNSNSASFNLASDWSANNASAGMICTYVNTAGSAVTTDISTNIYKTYYVYIRGTDTDSDDRTICEYPIIINNIPI